MPRDRFKTSPQMDAITGVTYSHLPPSILNARRSHSSDRIFDIINEGKRYHLSPMPFVPYALALSLTVAYRKWRFSQTPMFRARGKDNFTEILPLLAELGKVWTSARINSNLGDVVMAHVSQAEHHNRSKTAHSQSNGSAAVGKQLHRRSQRYDSRRKVRFQTADNGNHGTTEPQGSLVAGGRVGLENEIESPDSELSPSSKRPRLESHTLAGSIDLDAGVLACSGGTVLSSYGSSSLGAGEDTLASAAEGEFLADLDESLFQSWDLMDAVDTCFVSNLDPGCPFTWPEYSNGYETTGYYDIQ